MQGHRIWVILALTWLFCSGSHADEETRLLCDDPSVNDAVAMVLSEHNKKLTEGNQLALYQILEAAKAQNESGEFLSVHFTARETDCAAGGYKAWQDCDYLQDSSKVIAGFRYRLQFDMQKSNCTKKDFKDVTEECHPDLTEPVFINCNSTVDVAPWRHELPDTSVKCEPGPLQMGFVTRRRPSGWSPLRNIHNFEVKPKKDDSSEESQEGKTKSADINPSQATAVVLTPTNTTSLNCPSKPWKDFVVKIAIPPRPPPPPPRPDSNDQVQSGFSDAKLVDVVSE
ncbi:kininogen-1 isoform X1 [Silurus asotus]|uniref:Kininogen-1 isoform X1 n=1 Tax=Silurus asotus TaxID=30991 RepID=A0AAD5A524_SILAS|nr:kininogen-1 isoform X1 [Silurus asotus]